MKVLKSIFSKIFVLALILGVAISFAGCKKDTGKTENVQIEATINKSSLKSDETAQLTVTVTGSSDTSYTLQYDTSAIKISAEGEISVVGEIAVDRKIEIMAIANADKTKSATASITLTAKENVKISIEADKTTIDKDTSAVLNVTVSNAANKAYTYVCSSDIVKIENDVVSLVKEITVDQIVTITVSSVEDPLVKASIAILVKAPVVEGRVGDLTSDMIKAIGNSSITVIGTLTDYYQDFQQSFNNTTHEYNIEVRMNDGAWDSVWSIKGQEETSRLADSYRRGKTNGLKDQYGNIGHGLEKTYINKRNEVESALVKDYMSVPSVWEAQHLWNHLGNLQISKFTYDAEQEVYVYNINRENVDDLYLMTYLSYSLTPMLSDTLDQLFLVVEDGKITKLLAQTEILYYGADTREDASAMSYTTIEVSFANVGTTETKDPEPFEASANSEYLAQAIEKMKKADNYTFHAKDTQTYAPSTDSGDYSTSSTKAGKKVTNNTSATGIPGCYGQVTKEAILYATTIEYTQTMDNKPYRTEYTGYKQIDEATYDQFAYDYKTGSLIGTKKIKGSVTDQLPKFDLSANIFEFAGQKKVGNKMQYTFVLRETAITRDVAMEVSAYTYAKSGQASTSSLTYIVVDQDGNLVSTTYPYSISDIYYGYVTTTYTEIGTTVLDEDLFDGYVPRVLKTSWDQYTVKYYSATHSTRDSHEEAASVVLDAIYGEAVKDLPAPSVLLNILGDNLNGPFFSWKVKGTDADGNDIYADYIEMTTTSSEYDENGRITNYEELMEEIKDALVAEGFVLSVANTDTTGGESGKSNRYVCFVKGDIEIVIENNYTKYFWIYFYVTGDWTLNRNK